MTTPYIDPATKHIPSVSGKPPASWGTAIRDDLEFLIEPPSVRVSRSGVAQQISNVTWTTNLWDVTDWDTDSFFTSSTTFTVPTGPGGKYHVTAGITLGNSTAGSLRLFRLMHEGAEYTRARIPADAGTPSAHVTTMIDLAAGDTLHMESYQDSGGNLNIGSGTNNPSHFEMR